jgi:hypothetical protein
MMLPNQNCTDIRMRRLLQRLWYPVGMALNSSECTMHAIEGTTGLKDRHALRPRRRAHARTHARAR